MKANASAPNKIIVSGEHSVVYGSWALAVPIEVFGKRNVVRVEEINGEARLEFEGDLGKAVFYADGRNEGNGLYFPLSEGVKKVFEITGKEWDKGYRAELEWSSSPKGTGNSSSVPCALCLAIFSLLGYKPSKKELFEVTFAVDNVYHSMKSSGLDPQTVVSDNAQKYRKEFHEDGQVTFHFEDVKLELPNGSALLLIDSYREGEKANTGNMIELFAKNNGISKKPSEMSDEEREGIVKPFNKLVLEIIGECREGGNAERLGKLMEENHAMLRKSGVSSQEIEECLKICKENGAWGGKLIGGGGNGGAVIAVMEKEDLKKCEKDLKEKGFNCFEVQFAKKGPSVDKTQ